MKEMSLATAREFLKRKKEIDKTITSLDNNCKMILSFLHNEKMKYFEHNISKDYIRKLNSQYDSYTVATEEFLKDHNIFPDIYSSEGIVDENRIIHDINEYVLNLITYWTKTTDTLKGKEEKQAETFDNIFTVDDWEKYVDALTVCEPQLLKKEKTKYKFVGNLKTHKGCVAQWFKFLKIKGIIDQSINRDQLAQVLSNEIRSYSISGSTIDNESSSYKQRFQRQLEDYFINIY